MINPLIKKLIIWIVSKLIIYIKNPYILTLLIILFVTYNFYAIRSFNNKNKSRHKPILPDSHKLDKEDPYVIDKPEISLAIYEELNNKPHYYKIDSKKNFKLYVGILTPKLSSESEIPVEKKIYFDLLDSNFNKIYFDKYPTGLKEGKFEGETDIWWKWFEPFGRKDYWVGPQIGGNGTNENDNFKSAPENHDYPAGVYYIKIYNNENKGRYSLAVGDKEEFSISDIVNLPFKINKINKFWK